ncbi:MAG TPA: hypothetical protein H9906_04035 [Candidatus Paenalcaligenes intestinipullorum]|uniref:Uncharacterized protein n=1 Tax=Candidatus Paenalcaligenes intestinipullorum TaxID=2838718 RepID=A0A9D2RGV9_9BURK|nr:hypothetical protein [Candidatus Paenalcaligenes intestinipullorum]
MDFTLILLTLFIVWQVLRVRYQRAHIALLGQQLAQFQLEKHMETLTSGYTRAIQDSSESRQLQIFDTLHQTEYAVAAQLQGLAKALDKLDPKITQFGVWPICVPFVERVLPSAARDFRQLVALHAAGIKRLVDNDDQLEIKPRAFHLSAELYLFQHSCHWFCKSKTVADARLLVRHQVDYKKVLASVSEQTRRQYEQWLH